MGPLIVDLMNVMGDSTLQCGAIGVNIGGPIKMPQQILTGRAVEPLHLPVTLRVIRCGEGIPHLEDLTDPLEEVRNELRTVVGQQCLGGRT